MEQLFTGSGNQVDPLIKEPIEWNTPAWKNACRTIRISGATRNPATPQS
ncbi:hypothetical protein CV093_13125 [Oceanobacillus sp. 143]|nr:hypothetical protein CV093_13125 [Oceanobacillus sp. 143]